MYKPENIWNGWIQHPFNWPWINIHMQNSANKAGILLTCNIPQAFGWIFTGIKPLFFRNLTENLTTLCTQFQFVLETG